MSLLEELNTIISGVGMPVETGVFGEEAPATYVVITPLVDLYDLFSDDTPHYETQEARLSLFTKGNYQAVKSWICSALLAAGITITDRRYIGHEDDTGYHNYAIDTAKVYSLEE